MASRPSPALVTVLEGTVSHVGTRFFEVLVQHLATGLGVHGAWVTEYLPGSGRLRAFAFWLGDAFVPDYEYTLRGTPCLRVIDHAETVHVPERVVELFPDDHDLSRFRAVSYFGVPLTDADGTVIGNLAVVDTRPMPPNPDAQALITIFAGRASAEVQRLRLERSLRERERELRGLLDGAMDAIIGLDDKWRLVFASPAATRLFAAPLPELLGASIGQLIDDETRARFPDMVRRLGSPDQGNASWIPGGLGCLRATGEPFPAEATLSTYTQDGATRYTLVLRDVNDRQRAEQQIAELTEEREILRSELRMILPHSRELVGESAAIRAVLDQIGLVATTDSTVLILGETGTGKELVARAVHAESPRRERPLVVVNCAAIPAALVESELFGHEKGAFTGATQRRVGRFTLANHGTIFLDEVGELPLDLQAKLLRVLQQREVEPIGSTAAHAIDVRIIAATNRDLAEAVQAGTFREDLYYRLNVFPITVPPLRDRGADVLLLARTFATRFATLLRRPLSELSPENRRRLLAYPWPGNVRELQNVMERAAILAPEGDLDLSALLPVSLPDATQIGSATTTPIYTAAELTALERENTIRALEACGWRVAGSQGAARRLGLKPSTLSSRMAALHIVRPARQ